MNRLSTAANLLPMRGFAAIAIAAVWLAALPAIATQALAQARDTGQTPAAATPPATGQTPIQMPPGPNPDDAWLARTAKLYYSSAKAGLTGFDCEVHPDWQTLIASGSHGDALPPDDTRLALLKSVKVVVHSRMKGGATFDWTDSESDKLQGQQQADSRDADTLISFHQTVQQMLESFLQFWTPFIENSVVPDSAEGLDITHTPTAHTIHARQGDTELTEVFSPELVLEQFNVNMSGISIKFLPSYKPTQQGLLVSGFRAHVLPGGAAEDRAQDMTVDVGYQPVNGFPIPSKLNIEVIGTGKFNFTLDGCSTSTQ